MRKLDLMLALFIAFGLGAAAALWGAARVEVWRVERVMAGFGKGI